MPSHRCWDDSCLHLRYVARTHTASKSLRMCVCMCVCGLKMFSERDQVIINTMAIDIHERADSKKKQKQIQMNSESRAQKLTGASTHMSMCNLTFLEIHSVKSTKVSK